jgi:hypothetical protein
VPRWRIDGGIYKSLEWGAISRFRVKRLYCRAGIILEARLFPVTRLCCGWEQDSRLIEVRHRRHKGINVLSMTAFGKILDETFKIKLVGVGGLCYRVSDQELVNQSQRNLVLVSLCHRLNCVIHLFHSRVSTNLEIALFSSVVSNGLSNPIISFYGLD